MGFGKMPKDCAEILLSNRINIKQILETEKNDLSPLKGYCSRVKIPFKHTNKKETTYRDYLPLYLLKSRFQTLLIELLSTLKKDIYKEEKIYHFDNSTISSIDGVVHIEALNKGFSMIKYRDIEFRRILWEKLF